MRMLPPSSYIADTGTPKGKGVFASRSFNEGEIVEACPVVVLQMPFSSLPEQLKTLVFDWAVLAGVPGTQALALGFGSMYNSDDPANLRYEADRQACLLRFIAVREIAEGEELTVNYNAVGGGATWHDNNWFDRMKIKPFER